MVATTSQDGLSSFFFLKQDGLPSFTALTSTYHFSWPHLSPSSLLHLFSFGHSSFFSSPILLLRYFLLSQVRNKRDDQVSNKTDEEAAGGAQTSLSEASSHHHDAAQTPTSGTIAVDEFTLLTEIQAEGLLHADTMCMMPFLMTLPLESLWIQGSLMHTHIWCASK
jgi:hypothetical protein